MGMTVPRDMILDKKDVKIAVIGLGYVGLPLAYALSKKFDVVGFDTDAQKIENYQKGIDATSEIGNDRLGDARMRFSSELGDISACNFYIVAVPTPIHRDKTPNLAPLKTATESIAKLLKVGDTVVYESTVYPGLTEEFCLPVLEEISGLACGPDFKIGYSPERISPGDKMHTFETIVKIVSACDAEALDFIAEIYSTVVKAGVYKASSIKVAEAAKVIENAQRDINIAFVNELSMIFNKLGISTREALEAAGTKWNFLNFTPGLVGGHCIGVDPYYLTYKSEATGCRSEVILAGRRINDGMGKFIVENTVKLLIQQGVHVKNAHVLLLGFTFKENVPDIRNTRVVDIHNELLEYGVHVDVFDPMASSEDMMKAYGIQPLQMVPESKYDAIVYAVPHEVFNLITIENIKRFYGGVPKIFIDVKNHFKKEHLEREGFIYWSL